MEKIQFIGMDELEDVDKDMVQTITSEYYDKIQRALKNETSLVVHIKTAEKEGHRHRYEVTVRAEAPTRMFESSKGRTNTDWDLAAALHNAFKNLEREIQHAFHD